jgi:alpha-L-fucosidase
MINARKYLFAFALTLFCLKASSQERKMQWFADAKLGIFIHWGIYSVNGISESWSFYNNYISYADYKLQLNGFTAQNYHPAKWVELIKNAGAKYAVITSKHHDGVALWDTKAPKGLSIPQHSAAKKDVLTPFIDALNNADLKTGIYYSLSDWSHPWYNKFTSARNRYDIKQQPQTWENFLTFQQQQLKELSQQYNPDLFWFDGDWEHSAEEWQVSKIKHLLLAENPNVIFNSRLQEKGDYGTPEQGIPIGKPKEKYWELCYTMNDSWGYQPYDTHYKTPNMIIRTLVDCISMGGNLLLDIGPKADGTIPQEQVDILKKLGRWTKKHQEAIYGTIAGPPIKLSNAKTALSKDRTTLFVYLDYKTNSSIVLKNLKTVPKTVSVIGYKGIIKTNRLAGNSLEIILPEEAFDDDVTVIKLIFNTPVELLNQPTEAIKLNELFAKNESPNAKLKRLIDNLANGNNPFSNHGLSRDSLNFEPEVQNLDSTVYKWVLKNVEAITLGQKGISKDHYQGASLLSADKKNLYLIVEGIPTGPIAIKGLKNQISRARIIGEGTILSPQIYNKLYWSKIPGIVYIDIPRDRLDPNFTIVNLLLDKEIDLYTENVGSLTTNN